MIYHGPSGLEDFAETITLATATLRPHRRHFDSIVVTGMSGVLVGAPVALRLRKPLVVLRKENDDSHQGSRFINDVKLGSRTLFLDDFVDAGDTRRRVEAEVANKHARIVGEYLYRDDDLSGTWL